MGASAMLYTGLTFVHTYQEDEEASKQQEQEGEEEAEDDSRVC